MKKSRFTDQQAAFALQQAETGTPVDEGCRKMGISQATFFRWKKVYGGLMSSDVRKLKQLEEENRRLRKLVADLKSLKKDLTAERGREMVNFVRTCFHVSVRRACRAVPANRSSYHYRSIRPSQAPCASAFERSPRRMCDTVAAASMSPETGRLADQHQTCPPALSARRHANTA